MNLGQVKPAKEETSGEAFAGRGSVAGGLGQLDGFALGPRNVFAQGQDGALLSRATLLPGRR
jgi:hypothetical protein